MMFHIMFALLVAWTLLNLVVIGTYARSIDQALLQSYYPPLRNNLTKNKHFLDSVARAEKERRIYMRVWAPLAWAALLATLTIWGFGEAQFNGTVAIILTVVIAPTIAKYITDPIQVGWLVVWTAGMNASLLAIHIETVQQRIAILETLDDESSKKELGELRALLDAVNRSIQK